jgi:hypothetical protein
MSGPTFTDIPPEDTQRIDELWCWVAVHANGAEGIMSATVPYLGTTPLISSRHATADGPMRKSAREIQRAAMHQADRIVRLELRRYVLDSKAEG